jgi:ribosomal protein S4
MNFVFSIVQAKQIIRHGLVFVNKKKIIYINYRIKKNDFIKVDTIRFYIRVCSSATSEALSNLIITPELPYLYIKHRRLLGVFLYDPLNNYTVLSKQIPSFFFGKKKVRYEKMNFHKLSRDSREIETYKSKKNFIKRRFRTSPYKLAYYQLFEHVNDQIPLKNVKLVLSYFLKN